MEISPSLRQSAAQWHALGRDCQLRGDGEAAERAYRRALELDPGYLRSLNNLAVLAMGQLRSEEAEQWLQRGLAAVSSWADPAAPLLLNTLCQLRLQQQRAPEALLNARQLVQLSPEPASWSNLAVALRWCGRPLPAFRAQRLALACDDPSAEVCQSHGGLDPQGQATRQVMLRNLGTMVLALNPWSEQGWRLMEARLACEPSYWQPGGPVPPWPGLWRGERVSHLHLWDEQGFGDAIQCLRWVPLAAQRCDRLTLMLRPGLLPLVQRRLALPAWVELEPLPEERPPWQRGKPHLPLMSLPLALKLAGTPAMVLPGTTVLVRNPAAVRERCLGLVWAAGRKPEAEADRHARTRSIGLQRLLQLLEPLLAGTGIKLLPLQVGPDAAELEAYSAALLPTPDLSDWERTAAVLERLLGVITVDTAVAHLAGSLGVPTALLLSTPCDWRWGFSGEHTPWYASTTLLRAGAWAGLGEGMQAWLAELLAA